MDVLGFWLVYRQSNKLYCWSWHWIWCLMDWWIHIKGSWVLFREDCGTLRRQDVRHHSNPTQPYSLSLITPIFCFVTLTFILRVSCVELIDSFMSFLLCHWILITSLENHNKTLIAQLVTHSLETPHYSTDKNGRWSSVILRKHLKTHVCVNI